MLKSLKFLVLLTTVSYGYTSDLNNIINNNLDNYYIINDNNTNYVVNNNTEQNSNNNKYLGKKKLFKVHKPKQNNAYKYLFSDDSKGKYFKDELQPSNISNPEYKQFMESVYDMFDLCLYDLFENVYGVDLERKYDIDRLESVNIPIQDLMTIAKLFDSFKFGDNKNHILANNSVDNLNKYIANQQSKRKKTKNTVSIYKSYKYYLRNHIIKLYYQTINALKKSIENHEPTNNQVEIVNESGEILTNVLDIVSGQLFEEQNNIEDLIFKEKSNQKKEQLKQIDYSILEDLSGAAFYYCVTCKKMLQEFNYYNADLQGEFDDIHLQDIINSLNEIINIDKTQNIVINKIDDNNIIDSNKKYFDKLLENLNIDNDCDVQACKNFLINGKDNLVLKEYLIELIKHLNILKNITDKKIKYQIEHEHKFTFDTSIYYNFKIMINIFKYLSKECKQEQILSTKLGEFEKVLELEKKEVFASNY